MLAQKADLSYSDERFIASRNQIRNFRPGREFSTLRKPPESHLQRTRRHQRIRGKNLSITRDETADQASERRSDIPQRVTQGAHFGRAEHRCPAGRRGVDPGLNCGPVSRSRIPEPEALTARRRCWAARVIFVLCRTVAKVDSIGFVVSGGFQGLP
jgi:hypothetical protein